MCRLKFSCGLVKHLERHRPDSAQFICEGSSLVLVSVARGRPDGYRSFYTCLNQNTGASCPNWPRPIQVHGAPNSCIISNKQRVGFGMHNYLVFHLFIVLSTSTVLHLFWEAVIS
jgi:hypothetical protein